MVKSAAGDRRHLLPPGRVGQAEMHAHGADAADRPSLAAAKASGAASQTNSTPSSSAFFTSRIEPGMFALSRR